MNLMEIGKNPELQPTETAEQPKNSETITESLTQPSQTPEESPIKLKVERDILVQSFEKAKEFMRTQKKQIQTLEEEKRMILSDRQKLREEVRKSTVEIQRLTTELSETQKLNQSLQQSNDDLRNRNGLKSRKEQEQLEEEIKDVRDQNSKLQIQVNKSSVEAVDDAAVKDIDVPWIVQKMTGSNKSYPKKERDIDWEKQDTVLEVKDLCLPKKGGGWLLDHVSFKLKRGEILGIYGLMGAGRTEVFECLMGLHPEHTGEVYVDGKKIKIKNIAEQIKNGFALVPEDRQAEGLVQTLDIEKNISLSSLKTCCNKFVLSKQKEDEYVDAQIKDIHIKVADKHLPILSLSGGNQQKCVIGKGVLTDPKILLMDEPSRGIDIGAKTEVFDIINQYADRGLSIICVSSELKEMLAIANRVVVLSNGIKTAEFTDDEITEDNLVLASYKGHH